MSDIDRGPPQGQVDSGTSGRECHHVGPDVASRPAGEVRGRRRRRSRRDAGDLRGGLPGVPRRAAAPAGRRLLGYAVMRPRGGAGTAGRPRPTGPATRLPAAPSASDRRPVTATTTRPLPRLADGIDARLRARDARGHLPHVPRDAVRPRTTAASSSPPPTPTTPITEHVVSERLDRPVHPRAPHRQRDRRGHRRHLSAGRGRGRVARGAPRPDADRADAHPQRPGHPRGAAARHARVLPHRRPARRHPRRPRVRSPRTCSSPPSPRCTRCSASAWPASSPTRASRAGCPSALARTSAGAPGRRDRRRGAARRRPAAQRPTTPPTSRTRSASPVRQLLANRTDLDQLIQRVHSAHYADVVHAAPHRELPRAVGARRRLAAQKAFFIIAGSSRRLRGDLADRARRSARRGVQLHLPLRLGLQASG